MRLVDRLVTRAQEASPLNAGPFSDLAAAARDERWIDQSVNSSTDQEQIVSTDLLMRALRAADYIIAEIEANGPLLQFFAGTSRDILVYECVCFSVQVLSDALRRNVPSERISAVEHFQDVACLTASILASQHISGSDLTLHCQDRVRRYLRHVGSPREMTDCLIEILISSRGATVVQLPDIPLAHEVGIETEVDMRIVTNAAVDICIGECVQKLLGRFMQSVEPTLPASAEQKLPQTDVHAGGVMPYYCVQSRAEAGPMQTYWVLADSPKAARALVALNVPDASNARDEGTFDCILDDTKTPPPELILTDSGKPIAIMAR